MKVSSDFVCLLIIIAIGLAFLIARRVFIKEAFENAATQQCGVDMAPCAPGTRCMNGYCFPDLTPRVRDNDLPVYP